MKLYEFFNEDNNIIPLNKAAPNQRGPRVGYPPYFSDAEAERAAYEYNNQAQVDQDDGVLITSEDGKKYRIFRKEDEHSDPQHFEPGEVYLVNDDETNPQEYVDKDGYPDVEDLLHYHSKQGYIVGMEEGTRCWKGYKKKGMKTMFGKRVPNCVKNETYNQDDFDKIFGDRQYKNEFAYLDDLRDSGVTNMFGASEYLVRDLGLDKAEADKILVRWMRSKENKPMEGEVANFPGTYVKRDYVTINGVKMLRDVWDYMSQDREEEHGYDDKMNAIKKGISNFTGDENTKILKKAYQLELRNFIDEFKRQDMDPQPFIDELEQLDENFADGKKKGKSRPGRVKKAGASCNGSVTSLRKRAKNSSGEKSKMYHWCANMKSGKKKK